MKDAYYFPHDCNARYDQKLVAVRAVHGMKGYGIYFGLIEMLREANGYQIPSKINLLAFDLQEDEKDIKDILENYDLFKTNGTVFWSETLNQRMGHLTEVREKRALAGKAGGLAKARVLLQQKPSKSVAVKESKVKESKEVATTPQGVLMDKFLKNYRTQIGEPYHAAPADYVLLTKLLKSFDEAAILEKIKLLFLGCTKQTLWFSKEEGLRAITIKNLFSHWNEIYEKKDKE